MVLERPEDATEPTEPGLHLVGDAQPTGRPRAPVDVGQEPGRQHDLPGHARAGLGEVRAQSVARRYAVDHRADLRRVPHGGVIVEAVRAAVGVGNRARVHPRRRAGAAGTVVLVRAHVDQRRGVPVVGGVHHHDIAASGVGPGQAKGELVRLAPTGGEEAHRQRRREAGHERIGVVEQPVVQVAGVRVERRPLLGHGPDDTRVGVTDVGHVVVGVDVLATGVVVQVLLPTAHDRQRSTRVRQAHTPADPPASALDALIGDVDAVASRQHVVGDSEQKVRIGADRQPGRPLAGPARAVEVARHVEKIGDQLDVHVWPPVAVRRRAADAP